MVFQSRHLALAVCFLALLAQPALAHARSAKAHQAIARHHAAYAYKYRAYNVRHGIYAMAEGMSPDDPFAMQVQVPTAYGSGRGQAWSQQPFRGAWQPRSARVRRSQSGWQQTWQQNTWQQDNWQQNRQSTSYAPSTARFSRPHTELDGMVEQQPSANGIPTSLVHRVIMRESGYNPRAAHAGNYGLMQIRLGTARAMGYSGSAGGLLDPSTNMTYAVRYLAGAYRAAGGNESRAVALYARGYNASRGGTSAYY
jgi:soluble lytic murein transglycosylase-like protein